MEKFASKWIILYKFNNIQLRGTFKTPKKNVLYIKCSKCFNSTKNNNSCQTDEIIDKYLKEVI